MKSHKNLNQVNSRISCGAERRKQTGSWYNARLASEIARSSRVPQACQIKAAFMAVLEILGVQTS
jgi:hypothetical protein